MNMARRIKPPIEDRAPAVAGCVVVVLWAIAVLLGLAFWGAVIWGIIELVSWLVTK